MTRAATAAVLAFTAASAAFAQPDPQVVAKVAGWTVYELHEGDIRLCYVETGLEQTPPPDPRLAGTMLQVAPVSLGAASNLVRLKLGGRFPKGDHGDPPAEFRLSFDWGIGYPHDFQTSEFPRWSEGYGEIVRELRAAESDNRPGTFRSYAGWDAPRGQAAGSYSLGGFSEAYAMARARCRAPWDALTPEPVRVSAIRVREPVPTTRDGMDEAEQTDLFGKWLATEPYLEFDIKARSFFPGGVDEKLTLRALLFAKEGDPVRVASYVRERNLSSVLSYGTRRIEFYRGSELFHVDDDPYFGKTYRFAGVCAGAGGRLNLLVSTWSGGGGQGEQDFAARYTQDKELERRLLKGPMDVNTSHVACGQDQATWAWGGVITPCTCGAWAWPTPYSIALSDWNTELHSAVDNLPVDYMAMASLLERGSRLAWATTWDPYVEIQVEQIKSAEFEVASVVYDNKRDFYASFQYVFARRRGGQTWLRLYKGSVGRLDSSLVDIHGFPEAHQLVRSGNRDENYQDQTIDLRKVFAATAIP